MAQPHPLFPDKGPLDIAWILLTRHEASGQVYHPAKWDPEELQGLEAIQELFGGGVYEFIARSETGILARSKVKLPGTPKPLVPEPSPAPPVPHVQQGGGGGGGNEVAAAVLNLIPILIQSQAADRQAMATIMQAQAAQQTQFLTAMMQASKADSNALVQAMAELSKSQTQTMAEAMKAAAASSGSKGDGDGMLEVLTTGFELGSRNAEKPNEVAETIGAVVQGIGALKEAKTANGAS